MDLKYFKINDFDSPDLEGSGINMQKSTLELLEKAREIAGIPFKITSGYRTADHNEKVGGVKNSSHLKGVAADVAVSSGNERYIVLNALIRAGFKRIGVAKTFIHCDTDADKNNSVWVY